MSQSENIIDILIGVNVGYNDYYAAETGGPHTTPSQNKIDRLSLSYNILANNYVRLNDAVDRNIVSNAIIVVSESEDEDDVRRELYTRLHNYVSSLYSYMSQVTDFVNSHVQYSDEINKRDLSPHDGDNAPCSFVRQLAFPFGIRHGLQHGDYQFLDFDKIDNNDEIKSYELRFLVPQFQDSSVRYPDNYIQYLSQVDVPSHNYPISYIHSFHRNGISKFHSDLFDWINRDT